MFRHLFLERMPDYIKQGFLPQPDSVSLSTLADIADKMADSYNKRETPYVAAISNFDSNDKLDTIIKSLDKLNTNIEKMTRSRNFNARSPSYEKQA